MEFTCPKCGAVITLITPQMGDDVRIHDRQESGRMLHWGSIVTPPIGRFHLSFLKTEGE